LEVLDTESGNGSGTVNLPSRQKRKRRRVPGRTGLRKRSVCDRRYRPGAAIPPGRFSKEDSPYGGVKGRAEKQASSRELAGHVPSIDPCWPKADAGSEGRRQRFLSMPSSGRACRLVNELFEGSLGTFFVFQRFPPDPRFAATHPYPTFSFWLAALAARCRQENFSLHARKLAKLQRQNSHR
jgi:hypothetical protein